MSLCGTWGGAGGGGGLSGFSGTWTACTPVTAPFPTACPLVASGRQWCNKDGSCACASGWTGATCANSASADSPLPASTAVAIAVPVTALGVLLASLAYGRMFPASAGSLLGLGAAASLSNKNAIYGAL